MARTSSLLLFCLAGAVLAIPFAVAQNPPRKKVLITYFVPFGGANKNSSEMVAKKIAAAEGLGVDIELCRLPVIFDQAAVEAEKCFKKSEPKPGYAISLGSGNCRLEFETAAHNRDSTTLPDNSGIANGRKVIDPNGPSSVSMTFPVDELLCGSDLSNEENSLVTLSANPGDFVCNNTAYLLANFIMKSAPQTRYGFVHVPAASCEDSAASLDAAAEILKKYIKKAVANDDAKSKTEGKSTQCRRPEAFPQSLQDFGAKIASLKDIGTKACRAAYLNEAASKRFSFIREKEE